MLRDLTIQNYRCFKDFHIDGLARVNLIVGSNNSGKTSLLEAVYLLVNQLNFESLIEVLHNRGEIADKTSSPPGLERANMMGKGYQFRHIFHGHQLNFNQAISFQSKQEQPLELQIQVKQRDRTEITSQYQIVLNSQGIVGDSSGFSLLFSNGQDTAISMPVRYDGFITEETLHLWKQYPSHAYFVEPDTIVNSFLINNSSNLFITTSNLTFEQMASFWDGITLTPKEDNVVRALQILEPNIQRISFTTRQNSNSGVLLKLDKQSDPIPLESMGEGMRRILSIAMAAVTVENGFLLVDEIESGLYYETQVDMWRLVLETAQKLNLQVFATTHSWDCISAFQEALSKLEDNAVGKLFRLSLRGEHIRAVEYTPDELSIAVRQSIEVR